MKQLSPRYLSIVAIIILVFAFKTQAQTGPSNDSLYIVGSATPGGWSNPIPAANVAAQTFTEISPTEYKINVLLVGGSEYKFISQNGSWTNNWGIAKTDDPTEINGGPFTPNSNNILAPSVSGTYTIDVNFASNIFTVNLFSTPKVIVTSFAPATAATGDTVTIKGSDFTGASAVSFGGTAATYFQLVNDSTIKAVVGTGTSGTVQVTATDGIGVLAGFTYNSNTLFIVGAATAGGWSNPIPSVDSAAQQFTQISPTEYKITVALAGSKEYKFIPQDGSWTLSYGITVTDDPTEINGGAFVNNGQNILSPALNGIYTIDVNFATKTFTTTLLSPDTLFIVGNATAGGWNNPLPAADSAVQQFTQISPTKYTLNVFLNADSSYKFIARDNGDWTYNWGIAITNDPTMVNSGTLVYGTASKDILAPSVSGVYTIEVDFANNTFTVISPLPVKIASFNAVVNNKTVITGWQTASELGISHYNVQHSTDGINFTGICTIKAIGSGSDNYKFTDLQPSVGYNYYRLQIVDNSGAITYSKIAIVKFAGNPNKFALYPTLIQDSKVNVRIYEATAGKATIKLIDLNGRVLQSDVVNIIDGSNLIAHKISATAKGSYIISVETATGKQAFKVIVE